MNYSERFRVKPGAVVRLKDVDPAFTDYYESHQAAAEETAITRSGCENSRNCSMQNKSVYC